MKSFKTIEQQIALLYERGLSFYSEEYAKDILMTYGYYEIINGYSLPFFEPGYNDKYKPNTSFEEIYSLFEFDKKLRVITFDLLQDVESQLKTIVAYRVAEKYGDLENDYLKRENYKAGKRYSDGYKIDKIIDKFKKIIADDTQPFKHYREKHGHCPPWILLKGATFGNIVNFIKLQKSDVKKQIIADFFDVPLLMVNSDSNFITYFIEMLYVLLKYRNRSAHGGRLYNYTPSDCKITFYSMLHDAIGINSALYRKGFGQNDWNTILLFVNFMKNKSSSNKFKDSFLNLINEYIAKSEHVNYILRTEMKLSENIIS